MSDYLDNHSQQDFIQFIDFIDFTGIQKIDEALINHHFHRHNPENLNSISIPSQTQN
jgi:hypothetical protein